MKQWSKIVLVVYLLVLLWLVLFKFSSDVLSVIAYHQSTSISLVPFGNNSLREMFENLLCFIPLGLLLGINYKAVNLTRKLAFVFVLSLAVEVVQFALKIGEADITDVIMNTFGGFVGLALYDAMRKRTYLKNDKLDLVIDILVTVFIAVLLAVFLWFRFFVLKVRY